MKETTYGQRGGVGPTAGMKARTYAVKLPDGSLAKKRTFLKDPQNPVGYAYNHEGKWYVAGIDEPNTQSLSHMTQCPATEVTNAR